MNPNDKIYPLDLFRSRLIVTDPSNGFSLFYMRESIQDFILFYYYYFVYTVVFENLFMNEIPNPRYYWTEKRDSFTFGILSVRPAEIPALIYSTIYSEHSVYYPSE